MKTVSRAELLSLLETVSHGLSPREVIEQSSCFVFEKGEVFTYNDEVSCRAKTDLKITGAVQAKPLMSLLEKMPEENVDIMVQESELIIVGKKRRGGIRMENEVLLPVKNVERPGKFIPLHEDFLEAINLAQESAGKDESKFWTTCVHLHPKWVEACDNSQVTRFRLKTGVQASTLVRQSAIKCITNLEVTEFSETASWIHFRNKLGLVVSCRRYIEDYPTEGVNRLLKVEGTSAILPKGLAEATERADVFSSENADDNQVRVILSNGKIKVRGEGVSGWYSETKKLKYKGPSLDFTITPKLLIELTRRHNECFVSREHLRVDGGRFVFVACLNIVGEKNEDQEEGTEDQDAGKESGED